MVDKEKVKKQYLDTRHLEYHKSQFKEPKGSTIALCGFTKKILVSVEKPYAAVDVGCGGGGNIYHLSKVFLETKWVGIDFADEFFYIGREYLPDGEKFRFLKGDFFKLKELFSKKSFDFAFSIQTLSWLPGYEDAIKEIIYITKRWIFVTSLFSDFNVDVFSTIFEYNNGWDIKKDYPYNYNIYSFNKFKDFCIENGAREVISEDFIIDIDIPIPKNKEMQTYTVRDFNGKRLQFSVPLLMPWKMIAIRME